MIKIKYYILLLFLLPSLCFAEPRMTRLSLGQTAPYPGILLNNEAEAQIRAKYEEQQRLCALNLDFAKKQKDIDCISEKELLKNDKDSEIKRNKITLDEKATEIVRIKEQLKKYENQYLYDCLYAGAGFVVGAGLTVLIVSVLK